MSYLRQRLHEIDTVRPFLPRAAPEETPRRKSEDELRGEQFVAAVGVTAGLAVLIPLTVVLILAAAMAWLAVAS